MKNRQASDLLTWDVRTADRVSYHDGEMVRTIMWTEKTKSGQSGCVRFLCTNTLSTPLAQNSWFEKKNHREDRTLTPLHLLVKNEHTTRCLHKSVLMWACLHTCIYELSWMWVLSLHESAVITQWRCPWGGSSCIWLRTTSPHLFFLVSDRKTAVCVCMLTDGSRVRVHTGVIIITENNYVPPCTSLCHRCCVVGLHGQQQTWAGIQLAERVQCVGLGIQEMSL